MRPDVRYIIFLSDGNLKRFGYTIQMLQHRWGRGKGKFPSKNSSWISVRERTKVIKREWSVILLQHQTSNLGPLPKSLAPPFPPKMMFNAGITQLLTNSKPQSSTAIATTDLCPRAFPWWGSTPFVGIPDYFDFPGYFDLIFSTTVSGKLPLSFQIPGLLQQRFNITCTVQYQCILKRINLVSMRKY